MKKKPEINKQETESKSESVISSEKPDIKTDPGQYNISIDSIELEEKPDSITHIASVDIHQQGQGENFSIQLFFHQSSKDQRPFE